MAKWYQSITTKLVASFMVLVIVISGLTFVYTYTETKNAINESLQDHLKDVSSTMASQITDEEIAVILSLQSGDESSPEYQAIVGHLRDMRADSDSIDNAFIMIFEGGQLIFLVDDYEDDPCMIGDVYDTPDLEVIQQAMAEPTASSEIYSDEWGSYMSGYAPVRNADGDAVFVLGIDMDASTVLDQENFIGSTIYVIMGLGVVLAGIIVGVLAMTIIRDIKKLNQTATKISMGDMNVVVDVKRKDEVGELADSFSRMVASLKFMMMSETEDAQNAEAPQEKK